ncbi:MAG: CidA/LrgA family protein [Endozoicomonas sp.]
MLSGIVTLLLFTVMGNTISTTLNLPVPGSVVGLILLVVWLVLKGEPSGELEKVSQFCIRYMAVLFIPAAVSVFFMTGLLAEQWLPLTLAVFVATPVTLVLTGLFMQWALKRTGSEEHP